MNTTLFIVDTLFALLSWVFLLRLWLQLARADYYNPISQFVVKFTQPVIAPLRRILPSLGRIDTASLALLLVVLWLKICVLALLRGAINPWLAAWMLVPVELLSTVLSMLFWLLLIRAILSWVSQGYNPVERVMAQLTEPVLAPLRRIIPPIGGLDLSVMAALFAIYLIKLLVLDIFGIQL